MPRAGATHGSRLTHFEPKVDELPSRIADAHEGDHPMNRSALAVSCLMLLSMSGCVHRVYTEAYAEPEPVVVRRTVVVAEPRPYYRRAYYPPRVVVRARTDYPRHYGGPEHREWSRRDGSHERTHAEFRVRAEASAQ